MKAKISVSFIRGVCLVLGFAVVGGTPGIGMESRAVSERAARVQAETRQRQIALNFLDTVRADDGFMKQFRTYFTGLTTDFSEFRRRFKKVEKLVAQRFSDWCKTEYGKDPFSEALENRDLQGVWFALDNPLLTEMSNDTAKGADDVLDAIRQYLQSGEYSSDQD